MRFAQGRGNDLPCLGGGGKEERSRRSPVVPAQVGRDLDAGYAVRDGDFLSQGQEALLQVEGLFGSSMEEGFVQAHTE